MTNEQKNIELERRELERQFRAYARNGITWDVVARDGQFFAQATKPNGIASLVDPPIWHARCWLLADTLGAVYLANTTTGWQFAMYQADAESAL